jgi:hypothetical protein
LQQESGAKPKNREAGNVRSPDPAESFRKDEELEPQSAAGFGDFEMYADVSLDVDDDCDTFSRKDDERAANQPSGQHLSSPCFLTSAWFGLDPRGGSRPLGKQAAAGSHPSPRSGSSPPIWRSFEQVSIL